MYEPISRRFFLGRAATVVAAGASVTLVAQAMAQAPDTHDGQGFEVCMIFDKSLFSIADLETGFLAFERHGIPRSEVRFTIVQRVDLSRNPWEIYMTNFPLPGEA